MTQLSDTARPARTRTGLPGLATVAVLAICTPLTLDLAGLALNPIRIVLLTVTAPLLVMLFMGRLGRFGAIDALVLGYSLWQVVAIAVNNPERVVQFSGSNTLDFLGGYLIGRAAIRSPEDMARFVKLLMVVLLVLLGPALIESQTGRPLIPELLSRAGLATIDDVPALPRLGLERAQAVFSHPIHYGLFASSMLALVFVGLSHRLSMTRRVLAGGLVIVSTVLSVSSGALLPLAIQVFLIGWALTAHRITRRWLVLGVLSLLGFAVIELLSDRPAIVAVLTRLAFNAHNVYMRTLIFTHGMENILANPVFGLGLNDWVRPAFMYSGSVDNFWILNGMRYGIPGVAMIAAAMAVAMIGVGRRRFAPGGEAAAWQLAWMLSMISLVLTLFTVHVWGGVYTYLMIMMASGQFLITWEEAPDRTPASPADAPPRRRGPVYTRFGPN
ncbi:O-antigen ligase domain-containing protein [Jannaschia seohaensis]|uniref:O-antigen ligase n=1 Tax=Jannaschia seohaensis TaxID=475081 RepID=A0A2Y9B3X8_9RHOB|nr:O-antigen ligase domain-containing protein [Jannaschia seohaensis]PWJ12897.1 O-antigen ligase [Jannaschia seohaensis]SSA50705.1 O-antigen ligase [Jannaschia seohaensis]